MLDATTLDATALIPPSASNNVPMSVTYVEVLRLGKEQINAMIHAWGAEKAAIRQELDAIAARHPEAGSIMIVDARWGPGPTIGQGRFAQRYVHIFDPDLIEGADKQQYSDGAQRLFEIQMKIAHLVSLREAAA